MELPLRSVRGEVVGQIEADDYVWAVPFNAAAVHQAMVRQQANARQGTADTKTRSEVSGGGKKPRPQKYTGRSRQGSTRAPHWSGGGVVFGPHPRDYRQDMPKKMRRLALRCVLSSKVREERLVVVEGFDVSQPDTKAMAGILGGLGVNKRALVVTRDPEAAVYMSARNLPGVKTLPASYLNVVDLLEHDYLVMTRDAVARADDIWGRVKVKV
ncbi:MAG: 50S ribosomal protein L4 [Chloroflexi bacterium]|nr:50S ribosomal protein L4 [Chloroflexota bacterium]